MARHTKPVEVVVFQDPEKSRRERARSSNSTVRQKKQKKRSKLAEKDTRPLKYDQKKAKFDIRKLGIQGMDKANKDSAMTDLLVELGAKPPKNRCYHIEEYKKMQKERDQEKEGPEGEGREARLKTRKMSKRKKNKDDILQHVDGQAGFYKNGVQFIRGLKR